jgi:hypothetical protein
VEQQEVSPLLPKELLQRIWHPVHVIDGTLGSMMTLTRLMQVLHSVVFRRPFSSCISMDIIILPPTFGLNQKANIPNEKRSVCL